MSHISIKPGDRLTVDGDIMIQLNHVHSGCAHFTVDELDDIEVEHCEVSKSVEEIREELREIAADIVEQVSTLDTDSGQELLGSFVSELFYSVAQRRQQTSLRQKQAEGIATARAKGVRFGRKARALPDNFDEIHRAWRNDEMTLKQAADACGMPVSSFYNVAVRKSGVNRSAV